ncbi:hypothetical protein ACFPC0_17990 [Streptomyces andamanensis]|uniref:Uncharacterized protein n=1 Tax=Streptomyces andamanensis TaxID=1565035 RepID=A0ABV8TG65_9ACTN
MNSPVNEEVQALMEAAHDRAAKALGLTCTGRWRGASSVSLSDAERGTGGYG